MKVPAVSLLLTGALIAGSFVTPAVADDRATCLSNQKTSDKSDACTRAITSGQVSGRELAGAYNVLGVMFLDAREYDKAIANLNLAIQTAPDYALAYHNRGETYRAKGDLNRAIDDYSEAIRIGVKDGAPYNARGVTYYIKGDYDRAIADFSEMIRINPRTATYYFNRGGAYEKKGDAGKALADFRMTLSLNPGYQGAADAIRRVENR